MQTIILISIILFSAYLQLKKKKAPLHPDTGQYLYRGFFAGKNYTFPLMRWPIKKLQDFKKSFYGTAVFIKEAYERGSYNYYQPIYQKIGTYQLIYWLYKIFKIKPKDYRIFFTLYNTITIISLFFIGKALFNPVIGLIAVLFFVVYLSLPYADTHQIHSEHYALLPLSLSVLLIILGIKTGLLFYFTLSGISLFWALLNKITFLIEVFFLISAPYLLAGNLNNSFLVGGSFLFSFLLFLLVLLFRQRFLFFISDCLSLTTFLHYKKGIDFSIHKKQYNILSQENFPISRQIRIYLPFIIQMSALFLGVGLFLIYSYLRPGPVNIFLMAWLTVSLFGIFIQGKFYFSHLAPLFLPSSLMAGTALYFFLTNQNNPYIWLLILISSITTLASLFKWFFIYDPIAYQLELYRSLGHPHTLKFAAAEVIADYINKKTKPDEKIKMWGYNSEIYVLSSRRDSAGFNEDKVISDPVQLDNFWGKDWRRWFVKDLISDPPTYIIDTEGTLNPTTLKKMSGFDYKLEKIFFSLFPVYRLTTKAKQPKYSMKSKDLTDLSQPQIYKQLYSKKTTLDQFIRQITFLLCQGERQEADRLTNQGIRQLIIQWKRLNHLK